MTATKHCGDCLEMPIGTLEKSKLAYLIVVEADPLKDSRKALDPTNIWMVIKNGYIMHKKD